MPKITHSPINMQVGIEDILPKSVNSAGATYAGAAQKNVLPEAVQIAPSTLSTSSVLDYGSSKHESALQAYVQPDISQRTLLIPAVFAQNMQEAKQTLEQMAAHDTNPVLQEALQVLHEDTDLQQILHLYRTMLMQG